MFRIPDRAGRRDQLGESVLRGWPKPELPADVKRCDVAMPIAEELEARHEAPNTSLIARRRIAPNDATNFQATGSASWPNSAYG